MCISTPTYSTSSAFLGERGMLSIKDTWLCYWCVVFLIVHKSYSWRFVLKDIDLLRLGAIRPENNVIYLGKTLDQMCGGLWDKHGLQPFPALPGEVTVDVSQDLHEVGVDRGEANTGSLPHVDGALLRQVHVVEVDELKLRLLLRPEWTQNVKAVWPPACEKQGPVYDVRLFERALLHFQGDTVWLLEVLPSAFILSRYGRKTYLANLFYHYSPCLHQ